MPLRPWGQLMAGVVQAQPANDVAASLPTGEDGGLLPRQHSKTRPGHARRGQGWGWGGRAGRERDWAMIGAMEVMHAVAGDI